MKEYKIYLNDNLIQFYSKYIKESCSIEKTLADMLIMLREILEIANNNADN